MKDIELPRPYVLSIAGFDPSGGAGVLADIKTFEGNRVYGLGVCSALTFQHESAFEGLKWMSAEDLDLQLQVLFGKYEIDFVKIGLVENLQSLYRIIGGIKKYAPHCSIIWDPILKASAGFTFHDKIDFTLLHLICKELYLLTPNLPEALALGTSESAELNAAALSEFCHVFLKGGHNPNQVGDDFLYLRGGKRIAYKSAGNRIFPKHGSGCVLSSAIAAKLAKGIELEKACLLAKDYTLGVLESNNSLLGYHILS
jgi:hydroxymethylpyrimidine/phosphomethylpyrimidine kinase